MMSPSRFGCSALQNIARRSKVGRPMSGALKKFWLNGERTQAKELLERCISATQAIHGGRLHEALGRGEIGPIHHLALRGLLYEDGRHTMEQTYARALEASGYQRWRSGSMESIRGSFVEWAPAGSVDTVGLPRDPYVFTSLCHVDQLGAGAREILEKLKPLLLGDEPVLKSDSEVATLPWLSFDEYVLLKNESQYAAWFVTNTLAVRPGHLDAVNHVAYVLNDGTFDDLTTCAQINAYLEANGWTLNSYAGAQIQAHDDGDYHFRQSSVVAEPVPMRFANETQPRSVPGIFHEFVEHPMHLPFRGFSNARALFTSTSKVQHQFQQDPPSSTAVAARAS